MGETSNGNRDSRAICNKTTTEIAMFTIQYITHDFFRMIVLRTWVASIILTESEKPAEASMASICAAIYD